MVKLADGIVPGMPWFELPGNVCLKESIVLDSLTLTVAINILPLMVVANMLTVTVLPACRLPTIECTP